MGFIRVLTDSIKGELSDQFLEYFTCDALSDEILVAKATKKGRNNRGSDDVISNGSGVVVNEGQCALIVSQGNIVEVCVEPGIYTYNSSTEDSVFTEGLSKGFAAGLEQLGKRIAHAGQAPTSQRVYYVNLKEILGNKFGTINPLPFRVIDARTGIDFDISVRCFGTYTFRIANPVLFFTNVCGNVSDTFTRTNIANQLRDEMLHGMIPAFERIARQGVRYSEIGAHTEEIRASIMENLKSVWSDNRGIDLVSLNFQSVDIPPEDLEKIKEIQYDAVYTNASMLGAKLGLAQAKAMESAASNPNAGPMMGFANMNMANMMGMNTGFANMVNNGQGIAPVQSQNWTCPTCRTSNSGKFCPECGAKRPE